MLEIEHIETANLQTIKIVQTILRECLPGDQYGIPKDDLSIVLGFLQNWENELYQRKVITVEE